jgi:hypothetical protein
VFGRHVTGLAVCFPGPLERHEGDAGAQGVEYGEVGDPAGYRSDATASMRKGVSREPATRETSAGSVSGERKKLVTAIVPVPAARAAWVAWSVPDV